MARTGTGTRPAMVAAGGTTAATGTGLLSAAAFRAAAWVISVIAERILSTTFSHAVSRSDHELTGFPSFGDASNLPMGSILQSHGRTMMGITLACPSRWRRMAITIS